MDKLRSKMIMQVDSSIDYWRKIYLASTVIRTHSHPTLAFFPKGIFISPLSFLSILVLSTLGDLRAATNEVVMYQPRWQPLKQLSPWAWTSKTVGVQPCAATFCSCSFVVSVENQICPTAIVFGFWMLNAKFFPPQAVSVSLSLSVSLSISLCLSLSHSLSLNFRNFSVASFSCWGSVRHLIISVFTWKPDSGQLVDLL